jgi:hypothetical protein
VLQQTQNFNNNNNSSIACACCALEKIESQASFKLEELIAALVGVGVPVSLGFVL